ncbi:MAG: branched-chain amino acid aminotransferase [Pseudomonadota bacterium]
MAPQPFDDRDGTIWFDGKMVDWRDANVHVLTHALHYASSVFEGQRAYNGKIFKLRAHTERLFASAKYLDFEIPYTPQEIDDAAYAVMKANSLVDCYLRPLAWRGPEQIGVAAKHCKTHVAIAAWPWPSYFSPEARMKGLRVEMAKWQRPAPFTAPTAAKAAGLYMICTLCKDQAEANGYDDAMMLDWRGQVAELTGANIFFVKEGVIHTPTPDCFLDGITRHTAIDMALEAGVEVIERAIMPDEMEGFEQAFITGTAAEVTPLREIGPYNFEVGELVKDLMVKYDALVRA